MTVTEVRGHGKQKGHTAIYRGKEYNVSLLPKMEIEVVVPDSMADDAIKAIVQAARTGRNRRRPRVRDAGAGELPDPDRARSECVKRPVARRRSRRGSSWASASSRARDVSRYS